MTQNASGKNILCQAQKEFSLSAKCFEGELVEKKAF